MLTSSSRGVCVVIYQSLTAFFPAMVTEPSPESGCGTGTMKLTPSRCSVAEQNTLYKHDTFLLLDQSVRFNR